MDIWNHIDYVWRKVHTPSVKIDDVWRNTQVYTKIDDVWRSSHRGEVQTNDIMAFRLSYQFDDDASYTLHDHLKITSDIPVDFGLTGDHIGFNLRHKGVAYHYYRGEIAQGGNAFNEGIRKYKGTLWAIMASGEEVNVSQSIPDDRFRNAFIQLSGYTFLDHYRYLTGWNSLFDRRNHWEFWDVPEQRQLIRWDPSSLTGPRDVPYNVGNVVLDLNLLGIRESAWERGGNGLRHYFSNHVHNPGYIVNGINSRHINILPVFGREDTYDEYARIGIARNISEAEMNMLRANGLMDHTIWQITMNGIPRPFTIEIKE